MVTVYLKIDVRTNRSNDWYQHQNISIMLMTVLMYRDFPTLHPSNCLSLFLSLSLSIIQGF